MKLVHSLLRWSFLFATCLLAFVGALSFAVFDYSLFVFRTGDSFTVWPRFFAADWACASVPQSTIELFADTAHPKLREPFHLTLKLRVMPGEEVYIRGIQPLRFIADHKAQPNGIPVISDVIPLEYSADWVKGPYSDVQQYDVTVPGNTKPGDANSVIVRLEDQPDFKVLAGEGLALQAQLAPWRKCLYGYMPANQPIVSNIVTVYAPTE